MIEMRSIRTSIFYGFLFIVFVFLCFYSLIDPEISSIPKKKGDPPDFSFEDISIVEWDMGRKMYDIQSKHADIDKEKGFSLLTNMTGIFYNQEQAPIMHVKAPQAELVLETTDMVLMDAHVTFVQKEKEIFLDATKLNWISADQLFLGFDGVCIQSGSTVISGNRLHANVPIRTIKILGDSQANIKIGPSLAPL